MPRSPHLSTAVTTEAPGQFRIVRSDRPGMVILSLHGELDLACNGSLAEAAIDIPPRAQLILDLAGLSFIDSSGLRTIMSLDLRSRAEGWSLSLARPAPAVRRLLTLCAIDDRVDIRDKTPEDLND